MNRYIVTKKINKMKKYKVLHHTLGNDESGKRAWLKPVEQGSKSLDDKTAADMNAQFLNTGIKYELVEDAKTAFNIDEAKNANVTHIGTSGIIDGDGIITQGSSETTVLNTVNATADVKADGVSTDETIQSAIEEAK